MDNYLIQPAGWKAGIYDLQSYEEYAAIKALRSSQIKILRKSPAHFKAAQLFKKSPSAQLKKSFDKGKAFDTLVLHGRQAFDRLVVVEPDLNRNKKIYKNWRATVSDDSCILTDQEKQNIILMQQAAERKKQFSKIFCEAGFAHRVIIWQCSRSKLWCKAEIDWITDNGAVVDLKSTADASFWFFARNASRLGYAYQGAFYLDGLSHITDVIHTDFYLAAVEVDPPFESQVFRVSSDQIMKAQMENQENMMLLSDCFTNDHWPGYTDQICDLDSGQYIFDDYEEEGGIIDGF